MPWRLVLQDNRVDRRLVGLHRQPHSLKIFQSPIENFAYRMAQRSPQPDHQHNSFDFGCFVKTDHKFVHSGRQIGFYCKSAGLHSRVAQAGLRPIGRGTAGWGRNHERSNSLLLAL